ncbi:autotransporter outer membrane beta-barrel domain-containing protein [Mesosutterella sp. AGMB02718]|uniref:Autotransporter outer membrane beta-barrel domain-containing protein n=1 Tax=Mesosutterella faecium TaxID=2925194 RepID=A0ABT7IN94_9BURK|nr:autotransporter outer membrane beta-barrel domain-containing protein [Mesosutterella sp. AGMB02718]MDL2059846.1 autotransporter outer membrane beta-barrel domain-containing protein [Mesosutterella sp. AGMB02718]
MNKYNVQKTTLGKPLLAAALASALCLLSAPASADFSYSNTVSKPTDLPGHSYFGYLPGANYQLAAENGSYLVDLKIKNGFVDKYEETTYYLANFIKGNLQPGSDGTFHFSEMNLSLTGDIVNDKKWTNGVEDENGRVTPVRTGGLYIRYYWHESDLKQAVFNIDKYSANLDVSLKGYHINPNALAVINDGGYAPVTVNVGDLSIRSIVRVDSDWQDKAEVANNGVYASGTGVFVNLNGNTYVNTNLVDGLTEAYSSDYGPGMSKNDALSAKYGGTVSVNQAGGHTVQLLGNLDVKKGTMNVNLDTAESYWHGHGTNLSDKSSLTVSLSNGAQWVPDLPIEVMQNLELKDGGIVNLHGFNRHTGKSGLTQQLSIASLSGEGGVFLMDLTASNKSGPLQEPGYEVSDSDWEGKDSSHTAAEGHNDFLYVKSGSGSFKVLPVDRLKLDGVSRESPIWFANTPAGVAFSAYTEKAELSDGFVYDYTPVVSQDVNSTDENKYGTNWYIVGLQKDPTPAADVVIADASLNYAAATSFLELDTLNKRMGEIRRYGAGTAGVWVRTKAGRMTSNANGSFRNNYQFYQLGADYAFRPKNSSGTFILGGAVHTTDNDPKFTNGSGDLDSVGASLYLSWSNDAGCYADVIGKYTHLKDDYTITSGGQKADASYSNNAWSFSLEGGKRFDLPHGLMIEPQAQLVYTYLDSASYRLSNGIRVHQDSTDSVIGRLGVRFGRDFRFSESLAPSKVYLKFDLYHEFSGDRSVVLTGRDAVYRREADGGDTWVSYGIGADFTLSRNVFLYADLEKSSAGDIKTKWQVNAGLRCAF